MGRFRGDGVVVTDGAVNGENEESMVGEVI